MTEILKILGSFSEFSIFGWTIIVVVNIAILLSILYGIPIYYVFCDTKLINKTQRKKRLLLEQIMLQKEFENEIEAEIKQEEENFNKEIGK